LTIVSSGLALSLLVFCVQFHSTLLTYIDVSECGLSQVPKGLPSSTRYAQLRRNNISSLSRTAFVECPFASIVVLDDNRIDEVDQQASGYRLACLTLSQFVRALLAP